MLRQAFIAPLDYQLHQSSGFIVDYKTVQLLVIDAGILIGQDELDNVIDADKMQSSYKVYDGWTYLVAVSITYSHLHSFHFPKAESFFALFGLVHQSSSRLLYPFPLHSLQSIPYFTNGRLDT